MELLCALPVFATGQLATRLPGLRVRRASRRPNRVGFAVVDEWRVSVTAYPGVRVGDLQETLLHELVHLHVGQERGGHRWHGRRFKATLRRAMSEAYGLTDVRARNVLHGTYAAVLERRRAQVAASGGHQLELPLAAEGEAA